MKFLLYLVGIALWASTAQAKDYPEFSGVYIGYNDVYVQAKPMEGHFSYILPSTSPITDQSIRREFVNPTGRYRVGGREIYGRTALIMRTYTGADYANGVVANISFSREEEFSILVVGRPDTRVGSRFNMLVGFLDFANSMKALSASQNQECADFAARGMAPLAGGFDACKAGQFGHDAPGTTLVNSAWGYNFHDIFQERIISQTHTEYVLKPGTQICPVSSLSADIYGDQNLRSHGWVFNLNDGRHFAIGCSTHIKNLAASYDLQVPSANVLEDRMEETCNAFGTAKRCR